MDSKKEFSKSTAPIILEFVHKIAICSNSYKLSHIINFYFLYEFPHFKNRSTRFRFQFF
ncbi:hypothetical protein LEP1GSC087_1975 [Leptospira interrogans serovar Bataviae str. L1111]|nr:hypothetical protein LEP1GSC087_1975 [Leptospira interrogans serovar Bataviae str. L1111]